MGAAASTPMHTVLDSSGTSKSKREKKKKLPKVNASISPKSNHIDDNIRFSQYKMK